jgi:hypothetical protein
VARQCPVDQVGYQRRLLRITQLAPRPVETASIGTLAFGASVLHIALTIFLLFLRLACSHRFGDVT